AAAEGLRQQARIVGQHCWQLRQQRADTQRGLRVTRLGRRAELAVLVWRLVVAYRQQPGVLPVRPRIELYPEQADRIDAEAYWPLGKPGLEIEQETLRPLVAFRLVGAFLPVIGIEVEITQLQRCLAVRK